MVEWGHIVAIVSVASTTLLGAYQTWDKSRAEQDMLALKQNYEARSKDVDRFWRDREQECNQISAAAKELSAATHNWMKHSVENKDNSLGSALWAGASLLDEQTLNSFISYYNEAEKNRREIKIDDEMMLSTFVLKGLLMRGRECRLALAKSKTTEELMPPAR